MAGRMRFTNGGEFQRLVAPRPHCARMRAINRPTFMMEKKSRILIADDFEELRTALTLMLKYAGFDVIEVENGRQAVEAAHQEEPDLILMDVTLPVVDGLQATRE